MFCTNCGKTIPCGVTTCPSCNYTMTDKLTEPTITTALTAPIEPTTQKKKFVLKELEKWSTIEFVGYLVLTFLFPLASLIIGITGLSHPARKSQAIILIIVSIVVPIIETILAFTVGVLLFGSMLMLV